MTRREQLRNKRAAQQRQQNYTIYGILAVAALAVAGLLAWPSIAAQITPLSAAIAPAAITYKAELVDGKNYGPKDAKVVVREFADFQCPYCGLFSSSVGPIIKQEFIDAGLSVRFEFRHFVVVDPISSNGESRSAAQASECAADQGKFWEYHDYVYANQDGENRGHFSGPKLRQLAEAAGLDLTQYDTCIGSSAIAQRVRDDEVQARQLNLNGTPTVLINNQQVPNPMDIDAIRQAIQVALATP